jgi:hypothetical protein
MRCSLTGGAMMINRWNTCPHFQKQWAVHKTSNLSHRISRRWVNIPHLPAQELSMDWFKGKFTGKPHI